MAFTFEGQLVTEPEDLNKTSLNPDPLSRDIGVAPPPEPVREEHATFGGEGEDIIADEVQTLDQAKSQAEERLTGGTDTSPTNSGTDTETRGGGETTVTVTTSGDAGGGSPQPDPTPETGVPMLAVVLLVVAAVIAFWPGGA